MQEYTRLKVKDKEIIMVEGKIGIKDIIKYAKMLKINHTIDIEYLLHCAGVYVISEMYFLRNAKIRSRLFLSIVSPIVPSN